jgi:cytochrome c oxidase subunit 2
LNRRSLTLLGLGLAFLVTQACGGEYPQSALHPTSDFAERLDGLFWLIFWWAVGVFVVVEGILIYTIIRFRARPDSERPKPVHGHTILELGWTIAPALILVAIAIPTIQTIFVVDNPPAEEADVTIEVIGRQWWWEFRYPDLGIVTANEAHVPVGQTVDVRLRSADVLHSFWVPRLGGKRDLVPGRENFIWFRPDSIGVFWGQCAEYCGTSHALMSLRFIVDSESDFDAWVANNQAPAVTQSDRLASQGRNVFLNNACISCHTIRGTNAQGQLGPDLTHVGSRLTIAAGVLDNNAENLARWISDPQDVKPGNLMPNMGLTEQQVEQLVAYLQTLR